MKSIRTPLLGLLVPALFAMSPVQDELAFHPEEASSLTKSFEFAFDIALDDARLLIDGQDMSGMIMQSMPSEVQVSTTTTVVDTYLRVDGGKPLELTRLFKSVESAYDVGEESGSEATEELEGRTIRFVWNEDEGIYEVSVLDEDEDVDEQTLNVLGEDMDFRSVLPGRSVADGDTWSLEGERVWKVLMPGIDLVKRMNSADVPPEALPVMTFFEQQVERLNDGLVFDCEYRGTREVDGVRVGVIDIKVEGMLESDLVPMIEEMLSQNEMPVPVLIEYGDVEFELIGTGELLWNLEGGHMHSFQLDSDVTLFLDASASVDGGQGEQEFEVSFEFSGTMAWNAETE